MACNSERRIGVSMTGGCVRDDMERNKLMRILVAIISITVLALDLAGCSKNTRSYYKFLQYDPKSGISGRYEVDEDHAARMVCYYVERDGEGRVDTIEFRRQGHMAVDGFFGAARVVYQHGDDFERRSFQDAHGKPAANVDSVFSVRLRINDNGNPIDMFNYGKDGTGSEDRFGVTQYLFTLDDEGRIVKTVRINGEGERMTDRSGLYETRFAFDEEGNIAERSNYSRDGERLAAKDNVAIVRWEYDEHGNRIEERYLGADEQPLERKDVGVATVQRRFDDQGDSIEVRYYDAGGHMTLRKDLGVAMIRYKYDPAGNIVEQRFFGADEQLKDRKDLGVAIIALKYDSLGQKTEERYFGIDEQPKETKSTKIAVLRLDYDVLGNILRETGENKKGIKVDLQQKKPASKPKKPDRKEQDDFW
jgi:YD repeat-containing protein